MKLRPAKRTLHIQCPECDDVIDVPLTITLRMDGTNLIADAKPDMADLWSHVWSHTEAQP